MSLIFTLHEADDEIEYRIMELACEKDFKEGYAASYQFEKEDEEKLEKLEECRIYEMQEGVYELPSNLTMEEIKTLLESLGFIDAEKYKK